MHIPDGFISTPINCVTGLIAAATLSFCINRITKELSAKPFIVPLLATTAAFVFAAQMLNFPIGGGTSGHFLGAATVAALLGPWSACLALAVVLSLQCLLFADGGLLALGSNILNMGIVGGILAYPFMRGLRALLPNGRAGYVLASGIASWASVVAASLCCSLELAASSTSPFYIVVPAMVGTHMIIGLGEAMICMAVVTAVAASRPDILPSWACLETASKRSKTPWRLAAAGMALAIALAAFASPHASASPDGLDKVAEDQGFDRSATSVWPNALFPDYKIETVKQKTVSTSLAGLIGTMLTFALGFIVIKLATQRRKA